MVRMKTFGAIIPCYKGNKKTLEIIEKTLELVNYVVLVDDCCPNYTGQIAQEKIKNKNLIIFINHKNIGVGGSVKKGIKYLLSINCDYIIKIDADGQIPPSLINKIKEPLLNEEAEAIKGNRFTNITNVLKMPKIRLIGNLGLSFLNKVSTGYWELFDPTNGFIAFNSKLIRKIRLSKLEDRYFFESSLLFECSLANISIKQIPMEILYVDEISSLKPLQEIYKFAWKHFLNLIKRIIYQYFLLDFNTGSIELIGSFISFLGASIFFIFISYKSFAYGGFATPGEANLLILLIIISFQLFISFLFYDATQKPFMRALRK